MTAQEASTNPRQQLLADALDAVSRTEYGGPEDSFQNIANLWNVYLAAAPVGAPVLTPADVAIMLMQLKVARLMTKIDHRDSIVDIAGYAACLAEIVEPDS